jgi:hypothetical protein
MAMNLRLAPAAEAALREESERTGRSQQEIIRGSIDAHLAIEASLKVAGSPSALPSARLKPARTPFRETEQWIRLPDGVTSLQLLDRDDRI